jgi:cysteine/O-acetylserine efflux protein
MPATIIPSFLYYCFIAGITPGPANLCSLNASMRYGRKQALKQWRGLFAGFWVIAIGSVLITYFLGGVLGSSVSILAWIRSGIPRISGRAYPQVR